MTHRVTVVGVSCRIGDVELPQQIPRVLIGAKSHEGAYIQPYKGEIILVPIVNRLKAGHLGRAGRGRPRN